MLTHLDLFSGIGGFTLAAHIVGGIKTQQFVELSPFCQKVLRRHFPDIALHDDITTYSPTESYDIITAGFPCQPHSVAGKRRGGTDSRDMWGETYRVIKQVQPTYVTLENVPGLFTSEQGQYFRSILADLTALGYSASWQVISAASVGAVHKRSRLFITAVANSFIHRRGASGGTDMEKRTITTASDSTSRNDELSCGLQNFTNLCGRNDGLSLTLDRSLITTENYTDTLPHSMDNGKVLHRKERLQALGNSVVPQVAAIALKRTLQLPQILFHLNT